MVTTVKMDKIMLHKYLIMFKTTQKFAKNVISKEYLLYGRVSDESTEIHRKLHTMMIDSAKNLVVSHYSDASRFSKSDSPAAVLIAHLVERIAP